MPELNFWVAGIPQPQGSIAYKGRSRRGKPILTSDNANLRPWRSTVTWRAQSLLRGVGSSSRSLTSGALLGAVHLDLDFYLPRPKGHFGKAGKLLPSAPLRHVTKPDTSKLIRAVEDALTDAGVWLDDNQVVLISARKHYADTRPPGVHITVTPMAQPAATAGVSQPWSNSKTTPTT